MQDPFRPNSNARLMREAQIGFMVIGLLLCVLVYVAFYRLTNRSSRFDAMSRDVAVAQPVDGDHYRANTALELEQRLEQRLASLPQPPSTSADFSDEAPRVQSIPVRRNPQRNLKSSNASKKPSVTKLPKKQPKATPPVLTSNFGGTPSHDFLPLPSPKTTEAKTNSTSFTVPSVSAPAVANLTAKLNPATEILPKLDTRPLDSIAKALTRQLPQRDSIDQSINLAPQVPESATQDTLSQIDLVKNAPRPVIAQTSAFEPIKSASAGSTPATVSQQTDKPPRKVAAVDGETHEVKKGDSLWTIAQAIYGDGRYFRALYEINRDSLSASGSLPAGTVLKLSSLKELKRDYAELCPKPETESKTRASLNDAHAGATTDDDLDRRFYLTEDGDTLFEIARQRLGQASRYLEIQELNRFRIPETANHLTPLGGGIELLLPE